MRWLGPADALLQQAAWWTAVLCAAAAAYGFATDSALAAAGLAAFRGGAGASTAWMAGLWAAFGVGLTASLRAAAALAGPLAYRAGAALGALELHGPAAWPAVALRWGAGVWLLVRIARSAARGRAGAEACP